MHSPGEITCKRDWLLLTLNIKSVVFWGTSNYLEQKKAEDGTAMLQSKFPNFNE